MKKMFKKCRSCGALNEPENALCRKCSADLSSVPETEFKPVKKCSSCGRLNPAELSVCEKCSADLSNIKITFLAQAAANTANDNPPNPPQNPQPETNKYSIIIAKFLSIFFAIAAAGNLYAFHKFDSAVGSNSYHTPVFFFELIATAIICLLPVMIYRYSIRKKALPFKFACPAIVLYGILVFVIMYFIIFFLFGELVDGSLLFLFLCLSYIIIARDDKQPEPTANAPSVEPYDTVDTAGTADASIAAPDDNSTSYFSLFKATLICIGVFLVLFVIVVRYLLS